MALRRWSRTLLCMRLLQDARALGLGELVLRDVRGLYDVLSQVSGAQWRPSQHGEAKGTWKVSAVHGARWGM